MLHRNNNNSATLTNDIFNNVRNEFYNQMYSNMNYSDADKRPAFIAFLNIDSNFKTFLQKEKLYFCSKCDLISLDRKNCSTCKIRCRSLYSTGITRGAQEHKAELSLYNSDLPSTQHVSKSISTKTNTSTNINTTTSTNTYTTSTQQTELYSTDQVTTEYKVNAFIASLNEHITENKRFIIPYIKRHLLDANNYQLFQKNGNVRFCNRCCITWHSFGNCGTCAKGAWIISTDGTVVCKSTFNKKRKKIVATSSSETSSDSIISDEIANQNDSVNIPGTHISKKQKSNEDVSSAVPVDEDTLIPNIEIKEENNMEQVPVALDTVIASFKDIMRTKLGNMPEDNCGHIAEYVIECLKALISGGKIPDGNIITTASDLSTTDKSIALKPVKVKTEKGTKTKKTQMRIHNSFVHQTQTGLHQHLPPILVENVDEDINNPNRQFVDVEPTMIVQTPINVASLSTTLMKMAAEQNKILLVQVDLYRADLNKPAHVVIACASKDKIYYIDGGQFRHTGKFIFSDLNDLYKFSPYLSKKAKGEFYENCYCLVRESLSTTKLQPKTASNSITNVSIFKSDAQNFKQLHIRKILRDLMKLNLTQNLSSLHEELSKFTNELNEYFREVNLKTQLQHILSTTLPTDILEMQMLMQKIKLVHTALTSMHISTDAGWKFLCVVCVSKFQQLTKNQPTV